MITFTYIFFLFKLDIFKNNLIRIIQAGEAASGSASFKINRYIGDDMYSL